jgi:short-subunit dehydrogenase
MKINGAVAIVTGAGGGLGSCLVAELVDRGASRIYAGALRQQNLAPVTALAPNQITPMPLDITRDDHVAAAVQTASDVTLLLNVGGVMAMGGPLEAAWDLYERDIRINYLGPLRMTQAFVPVIAANGGGAILNVESILALAPIPALAGYCASKAAAHSMTTSLRALVADKHISVHALLPGPIDTKLSADLPGPKSDPRDIARAALDGVEAAEDVIVPDAFAAEGYTTWSSGPTALERYFETL